jgi:4-diphosphocytidyl-2-C-methyl-D-erythritol kinase
VDADPRTAELLAHAKVNLFLAVGARRADGYHEVTTVLQALELTDGLVVDSAGVGGEVSLTCTPDLGVADEENLAWRAADAWRRETGIGARVRLEKRVPSGAGLGGGSADAAASRNGRPGRRATPTPAYRCDSRPAWEPTCPSSSARGPR